MTDSMPPDPQSPDRRQLGLDEGVAIVVAFSAIGIILAWGLSRSGNWSGFLNTPVFSTSPQTAPASQDPLANLFGLETRPESLPAEEAPRTGISDPLEADADAVGIAGTAPEEETLTVLAQPFGPSRPGDAARIAGAGAAIGGAGIVGQAIDADPSPTPSPEATTQPEATASPNPTTTAPETPTAVTFPDVPPNYWAYSFIAGLVQQDVMSGFPNGEFRPEQPMTRAEFSSVIADAFAQESQQSPVSYTDIAPDYWANTSIQEATTTGFLKGYPEGTFRPDEPLSRAQAYVALVTGLGLAVPDNPDAVLQVYRDRDQIPDYAREKVAAATQAGLVVNYPNADQLNPAQPATRADVAAILYQALVQSGNAQSVDSPYIVRP